MPPSRSLRQPANRASAPASQQRRRRCRICNNLDPREHPSSSYQTEAAKEARASLTLVLDALALSKTKDPADGGCRFCNVLVQALDTFLEDWRGARKRVNLDLKEKGTIKISIDGDKWKGDIVEIYAGSVSRAPWPTLGTAHHIPINSGSNETFDFARRCIQDCLTNPKHTACRQFTRSASTAPKRLLDVGRAAAPIRLIDTQGKPFEYAALSHCWGTGPTLNATKANWQKLARNISFNALPPLFQDAVIITRQLGLRYLWIDSLCIIQDSSRDWETESSKMCGIYENSYFTIAATNSGDGSTRCLADRRRPVKMTYENTSGKEFTIRARKVSDHHPDIQEGKPAKPNGPLMARAWVLQEHVLSTRVLHYTSTELLFECRASCRCECMPSRKTCPTTPSILSRAIAKKNKDNVLWDAWHRLVEQYSQRNLTMPHDKFPAISGMASKIHEATGSSYFAGLWKGNLAQDLLWSVLPRASPNTYALNRYRAPAFSWASLDGPVQYDEYDVFQAAVTLRSSSMGAAGINPLGAVSDAALRLHGPTIQAILTSSLKDEIWEYTLLIKGTSATRLSHDCLLFEDDVVSEQSEETTKTVRRAHAGRAPSHFNISVLCLGIARHDGWMSALALGISTRGVDQFERLGTFAVDTKGFLHAEEKDVILV